VLVLSVLALSLVLGAAILHALWNLGAKSASAKDPLVVTLLATLTSVAGVAPLVIVEGINHRIVLSGEIAVFLAGTALLHTAYFLGLQYAYQRTAYTQIYPIARGLGPTFALIGSVVILGESPTIEAVVGAALIVGGVMLVGLTIREAPARLEGRAVRSGGLIGVIIGSYTLWDAYAIQHLGVSPVLEDWSASIGRALILGGIVVVGRRSVIPTLKTAWRPIVVIGLGSSAAYLMVLSAYRYATIAQVAPLREVGVVVGVLLGGVFLREGGRVRRIIGAIIVACGATLVALSGAR
jgi:drug/metabolite transporter (DMT)-like permease